MTAKKKHKLDQAAGIAKVYLIIRSAAGSATVGVSVETAEENPKRNIEIRLVWTDESGEEIVSIPITLLTEDIIDSQEDWVYTDPMQDTYKRRKMDIKEEEPLRLMIDYLLKFDSKARHSRLPNRWALQPL